MKNIVITIGISNSGKSTWASSMVQNNPGKFVRVNRDDIRSLLYGYNDFTIAEYYTRTDLNKLEKQVTKYEDILITEALNDNKTVIIDATHLKKEYLDRFKYWNVPIELKWFDVMLKEALTRNMGRPRKVSEDVIISQYAQYLKLSLDLKWDYEVINKSVKQDENLPKAIICDIDGCLAKSTGRNMFDWSRINEDVIQEHIRDTVNLYYDAGYKVFIFTGRDAICYSETECWLNSNETKFHHLFSRGLNDFRKDSIIKRELFDTYIKNKYFVSLVIDDRVQVLEEWVSMGLPVLSNNPLSLKF